MSLPKLDVPIYSVDLLSTGKNIRFRPFTVKEEKLFLMANESDDISEIMNVVKQVLNNCILDEIDVDNLPMFDIENIFLNVRARSVGEVVNLKYKCNNTVKNENQEDIKCNNLVDIDVNILDIKPEQNENHSKKIQLTENIGVMMKYPSLKLFEKINFKDDVDTILETTINCIDYIYDKENVYYAKDTTKEDLVEFLESLQTKDLEKIKDFFETMPKLKKNIHFHCKKCNYEEDINVEGLESFFV